MKLNKEVKRIKLIIKTNYKIIKTKKIQKNNKNHVLQYNKINCFQQ